MINLRDPTLHNRADWDGTVITSHAGYVSTFMLDDNSIMLTTQTKSNPALWSAWSVVFISSHPHHIDLVHRWCEAREHMGIQADRLLKSAFPSKKSSNKIL